MQTATFTVFEAVETGQTRVWVGYPGFKCRCSAETFALRNFWWANRENYGLEWRIESSLDRNVVGHA
jgi:hypothetical protein